jgi:hypothetical protein
MTEIVCRIHAATLAKSLRHFTLVQDEFLPKTACFCQRIAGEIQFSN